MKTVGRKGNLRERTFDVVQPDQSIQHQVIPGAFEPGAAD
jgi:hypothetical protein